MPKGQHGRKPENHQNVIGHNQQRHLVLKNELTMQWMNHDSYHKKTREKTSITTAYENGKEAQRRNGAVEIDGKGGGRRERGDERRFGGTAQHQQMR